MRLLSRILFVFVVAGSTSWGLCGQCATSTSTHGFLLSQNPQAKAAMIAAVSPNIEERVDPHTGEPYYVRRLVNPWSMAVTYQIVHFSVDKERFETTTSQATVEPWQDNTTPLTCPQKMPRDSSQRNRKDTLPTQQPRRSSTIKIAMRS